MRLILSLPILLATLGVRELAADSSFFPERTMKCSARSGNTSVFPLPRYNSTAQELLFITVDPLRDCAYGKTGWTLYRSFDRFETMEMIHNFDDVISGMHVTATGVLFVATDNDTHDRAKDCHIWRSMDGGKTFTLVKTIVGGTALNWSFASDREGNLFLGEYGPKMEDCSKTIWKTADLGVTWTVSLRFPAVDGIHVHVVAVDPWTDDVWAVNGDTGHNGTWRSTDHGETWTKVRENAQPTSVAFTRDSIWWGEDGERGAITRYDRATGEFREAFSAALAGNYGGSVYAMTVGPSGLIYACIVKYAGRTNTPAVWVGNGDEWLPLIALDVPVDRDGGFTTIAGPDNSGHIFVTGYCMEDPSPAAEVKETGPSSILACGPNPFNTSTSISFTIDKTVQDCRLSLYSVTGQHVRTLVSGPVNAGLHTVRWDIRDDNGRTCASGPYLLRFSSGTDAAVRKLMLVK